ncbi:MAG TPA: phosphoenolpyruvate--protein phosphotransferase [Erysipelotrichaceae bacterium]|nr:phosphoenolpyruvate--protein phosphotransferase [Erysipelotrichaceae bacterium]
MLKGIAASSGYAQAKVYKLERPKLTVTKMNANIEEELLKFENALEQTRDDIKAIKEKAVGRLGEDELAIFDAHIEFTYDPGLLDQVVAMIKKDSINAEFALDSVANTFITMFESMDDAYFRERAADIKDVSYRIKSHIMGVEIADLSLIAEPSIVLANDLTPSDTAQLDRKFTKGFVTEIGGRTSHSAIMARSLEIPAVVGVTNVLKKLNHGDDIIMDAIKGEVILNPTDEQKAKYQKLADEYEDYRENLKVLKNEKTITTDGHQVELAGNIGNAQDVVGVLENGGEGVGLYRTEFLYMDASELPSEEDQFNAYKEVLEAMEGKPVVVRTLDIGGDKELSYLQLPKEMNPFLGYRAIRLCLDRTDIFRTQLRALIRSSVYGKLRIMFPMIATLDEFNEAKGLYQEEYDKLVAEGIEVADDIEVGMMVEIPAAAVLADQFAKVSDFFSIGTNDLIQYSFAADRMNETVSYLYQPLNPSLLRLIKMTIDGGHKEGKWVGMCGEMAGDSMAAPLLLGLGLDEFSMSATSILEARKVINNLSYTDMQKLAEKALECSTEDEVIELLRANLQ